MTLKITVADLRGRVHEEFFLHPHPRDTGKYAGNRGSRALAGHLRNRLFGIFSSKNEQGDRVLYYLYGTGGSNKDE